MWYRCQIKYNAPAKFPLTKSPYVHPVNNK